MDGGRRARLVGVGSVGGVGEHVIPVSVNKQTQATGGDARATGRKRPENADGGV